MATVNKHTRAGRNGREIVCPKCYSKHKVYHFSWSALTCLPYVGSNRCGADVNKEDWIVALTDKEKYTGKTNVIDAGNHRWIEREVNTKMIQDTTVDINTSDYPDFADSNFESATWIDGSELTDEELEHLDSTEGALYECIERQLY